MNPRKVAAALNTLSVGLGELAEALIEQPASEPAGSGAVAPPPGGRTAMPSGAAVSAPPPAPIFDTDLLEEIIPDEPQGHLSVCPKHRVPYAKGAYGLYCKHRTEDPAWGKQKGDAMWCTITPKNADVWLRAQAAVA